MVVELGLIGFAIGAAFATFFSPCAYALLPAYLGYVAHDAGPRPSTSGVVWRGLVGAGGALGAFAILGAVAIIAGEQLRAAFPALEVTIGLVLVAVGTVLVTGRYPHVVVPVPRPGGTTGFFAFGAGYATAGAGCVAPIFFAVVLAAAAVPPGVGTVVIGAYALTFAGMLVAATLVSAAGVELATDRVAPLADRLTTAAGVVIVIGGIIQVAIGLGWTPPVP